LCFEVKANDHRYATVTSLLKLKHIHPGLVQSWPGSKLRQVSVDRATPGSQSSLREANRARLVDAIKRFGAITQVELAGATGLSTATVSTIVKELVAAGVLMTAPVSRSGRRAQQVSLARQLGMVAGVHFSQRMLRIELADMAGTVVATQHMPLPYEHRADTGMDRAARLIHDMVESVGATPEELLGVGLAVAAPVDVRTGLLSVRGVLRGWDEVDIPGSFSRRIGKPVWIDNDANLAIVAEHRYGAAQGCDAAVFVAIGHGVGAGLLVDGCVVRGHGGMAGEIGHVRVVENGRVCVCGNRGCLETVVNSGVLVETLRATHGNLALRDIIAKALAGDVGCTRVVADSGEHVGAAVAALCNVFNPQRVVVGGILGTAGEIALAPLRATVARASLASQFAELDVVQSTLGEAAEVRGAVALALDSVALPIGTLEVAHVY
jgi:predicted NBD/HSP70 family sugar kinase